MAQNQSDSPPRSGGVMAAPNRSSLTAKIVRLAQTEGIPGKTKIQLEVLGVVPVSGPTFADRGQELECFTFEGMDGFSVGDQVVVEAEYIGGPEGGFHQITKIGRAP